MNTYAFGWNVELSTSSSFARHDWDPFQVPRYASSPTDYAGVHLVGIHVHSRDDLLVTIDVNRVTAARCIPAASFNSLGLDFRCVFFPGAFAAGVRVEVARPYWSDRRPADLYACRANVVCIFALEHKLPNCAAAQP